MTLITRLRNYSANDDRRTAACNTIALIIAGNGPLYPLYVLIVAGSRAWPVVLTMLSAPFFFAVPWVARRHRLLGCSFLPLVGIANTLFSIKLLGTNCGLDLFFLPCITIAAMLFRRDERWLMLPLVGLGIAAYFGIHRFPIIPVADLSVDQRLGLSSLNAFSVTMLTACLGLIFSAMVNEIENK